MTDAKARERHRRFREKNRDNPSWVARRRASYRRWYEKTKNDPQQRIKRNLRARLSKAVTRGRSASAVKDCGCSVAELIAHIESQFVPGMSWGNYGTDWHIDHIIPLSSFDLVDRQQALAACHYTNLRPLWAVENQQKYNKAI